MNPNTLPYVQRNVFWDEMSLPYPSYNWHNFQWALFP